jgi:hypothetical protein
MVVDSRRCVIRRRGALERKGMSKQPPHITHLEWGRVDADGQRFRDVKLYPGVATGWDWRVTGMRHQPGVQVADVQELVDAGCRTIVLSRGMDLVLQVPADTVAWLEQQGVAVEVLESRLAAARYGELAAQGNVGLLLHTTC